VAIPQRFTIRPLYLQVRDLLLERITQAIWRPGSALPSETDLAKELGVSSGTVRKALDTLEGERVVSRLQGKGTFVNDSSAQALAWRYDNIRDKDNQGIVGAVTATEASIAPASATEQQRLCLSDGDRVVRIRRVHMNGNRPYIYEEASLPERLFPDLISRVGFAQRIPDLAQQFGLVLGRGVEDVSVAVADEAVAGKLSIDVGTPLLRLDRVVFAIDGNAVEWRVALCHFKDERYLTRFD
jgi:GntR family transcriptional regulator